MRIIHPIVCISIATAALSAGCMRDKTEPTTATRPADPIEREYGEAARAEGVNAQVPGAAAPSDEWAGDGTEARQLAEADNTAQNERDREGDTLTPIDQQENERDLKITQTVRQGVIKHDDLSMTAKNVKIITVDGVVTLRGPVDTATEKSKVGTIAKKVDGVKRVDNQLEIAATDDLE